MQGRHVLSDDRGAAPCGTACWQFEITAAGQADGAIPGGRVRLGEGPPASAASWLARRDSETARRSVSGIGDCAAGARAWHREAGAGRGDSQGHVFLAQRDRPLAAAL